MVIVLGLSDILLAVVVFVLFARPDQSLALAAWLTDTRLFIDPPDGTALERLEGLARYVRRTGLLLLFAWSFVTGAGIAYARI